MSSTDRRVVEMVFDNDKFEKGVAQTINTLKNLNESLNLTGVMKGLTLAPLSSAVNTVTRKFSAMEIAAITAMQRITNQAITMGENLVKSVSFDQISAGYSKYEEKTRGVQTIMAATGKDIEEVNTQLEKLNWFTDETSYNFTDMVTNIGKFTSSGVDLEKSVTAMEGISTWASLSGQGVNEASRAMYNLAQALSVGSVKLMDWKSIENANMATKEFKEVAMETAASLGTLTKAADGTYTTLSGTTVTAETFSQTLSDAWFSSEALMETLTKYGGIADKLNNISEESGLTATQILQAQEMYADSTQGAAAVTKEFGKQLEGISNEEFLNYLKELSSEEYTLGLKAFRAAQEAKTFTEVIDATKDAVSTGWMTTFEMIFGNYDEARHMWTDLANEMWDVFASGGEDRNELLKEWRESETGGREVLLAGVKQTYGAIKSIIGEVKDAFDRTFGVLNAQQLEHFVEKFKAFSDALQPSEEQLEKFYKASKNVFNVLKVTGKTIGNIASGLKPLADQVVPLFDAVLTGMGKLDNSGFRILADNISSISDIVTNSSKVILKFKDAVINTFNSVFSNDNNFSKLNLWLSQLLTTFKNLITSVEYFSYNTLQEIQNGFMGLFKIISELKSVVEGVVEIAGKVISTFGPKIITVLTKMFGYFNTFADAMKANGLDGSYIRDMLDSIYQTLMSFLNAIKEAFDEVFGDISIGDSIINLVIGIKNFIDNFELSAETMDRVKSIAKGLFTVIKLGIDVMKQFVSYLTPLLDYIAPIIDKFLELSAAIAEGIIGNEKPFRDFFANLIDTYLPAIGEFFSKFTTSISTFIPSAQELELAFNNIGEALKPFKDGLDANVEFISNKLKVLAARIKDFFGIEQDATFAQNLANAFNAIKNVVLGFIEDIKTAIRIVKGEEESDGTFKMSFFTSVISFFEGIGEKIMAGCGLIKNALIGIKDFIVNEMGVDGVEALINDGIFVYLLRTINNLVDGFSIFKKENLEELIDNFKNALTSLSGGLKGVAKAAGNSDSDDIVKQIKGIALAVLMLAGALYIVGNLDNESAIRGVLGMASCTVLILKVMKKISEEEDPKAIKGVIGLGLGLIAFALAMKIIGNIDTDKMLMGILGIAAVMYILSTFLSKTKKMYGMTASTGAGFMLMANGILVIAGAIALIGLMKIESLVKGLAVIASVLLIYGVYCNLIDGSSASKMLSAAVAFQLISGALLILVGAVALLGLLNWENLAKGMLGFVVILASMTVALLVLGSSAKNAAAMVLAAVAFTVLANAMLILLGAVSLLTLVDPAKLNSSLQAFVIILGSVVLAIVALNMLTNGDGGTKSATALILTSIAMMFLAAALNKIAAIRPGSIVKTLLTVAAVFAMLWLACAAFAPMLETLSALTKSLLIFSITITLLGVGCVALGVGITVLGAALVALGGEVVVILEIICKAVVYAIPFIIEIIWEALCELLYRLLAALPQIIEILNTLGMAILQLLIDWIPPICAVVIVLIVSVLAAISNSIYEIVVLLVAILMKIIIALLDFVEPILDLVVIFIIKIIDGLAKAIAQGAGPLCQAIQNLVWAFAALLFDLLGLVLGAIPGVGDWFKGFSDSIKENMNKIDYSSIGEKTSADYTTALMKGIDGAARDDGLDSMLNAFRDTSKDISDVGSDTGNNFGLSAINGLNNTDYGTSVEKWAGMDDTSEMTNAFSKLGYGYGEAEGEGFNLGLGATLGDAYDVGALLGETSTEGTAEAIDSHSPSKVFEKLGNYVGQGFCNGISAFGDAVEKTSGEMGEDAIDGMTGAISNISNSLDAEMDTNPRITPVLDLSEIQNGASQINGILSENPYGLNLATSLNSKSGRLADSIDINSLKTDNKDVVSAIDKLREDFSTLKDSMGQMKMVMDSGVLVGQLVAPMDYALGQRAAFKGRRN